MNERSGEYEPKGSPLPKVTLATIAAVVASSKETDTVFVETAEKMMQEQPLLADKFNTFVRATSRDALEMRRMVQAALIIYKMLDMQAEANQFDAAIQETTPQPPLT